MKTVGYIFILSLSVALCDNNKRDLLEILGLIHKDPGFHTLPADTQLTIVELVAAAENGVLVRYVDDKGFLKVLLALSGQVLFYIIQFCLKLIGKVYYPF